MPQFKNIVFVISNEIDDPSLSRVIEIAKRNDAALTLIDAVHMTPIWTDEPYSQFNWIEIYAATLKARKEKLEAIAQSYKGTLKIKTKVLQGKKVIETIRETLKENHDLVIKTAEATKGFLRRAFGSEDLQLLRKCPCPVLLIKSESSDTFKKIMAPIDFGDNHDSEKASANNSLNTQILDMSISLAAADESHLDVVHSYQSVSDNLYGGITGITERELTQYIQAIEKSKSKSIEECLMAAKGRFGNDVYRALEIETHLLKGDPKTIIPEQAKQLGTDLIVMGTVARTGIAGFIIGNTAETILNNIDCSVLALKPEGFVSPVTLT